MYTPASLSHHSQHFPVDVRLIFGLNDAHFWRVIQAFFPGISERNWSDEWLEEKNQEENTPKEWNGKGYTVYEAKQKQRQMESAMRAQREKVELLKKGDADPDEVLLARCKYQGQLDEYARFSNKMGLKQERERIYVDMRGRVAPVNIKYRKTCSGGKAADVYGITDMSIEKVNKLSFSTEINDLKIQNYHRDLLMDARDNNKSFETAYIINSDFSLKSIV